MELLEKIDLFLNEEKGDADDLVMFIENDGDIYRQYIEPIIKSMQKKLADGKFDKKLLPKAFKNVVEVGVKKYTKQFGKTFSAADKKFAAQEVSDGFMDEIEYVNEESGSSKTKKVKAAIGKKFTDDGHEFTIVKSQESNYPVLAKRDDGVEYSSKFKSARKEWEFPIEILKKAK